MFYTNNQTNKADFYTQMKETDNIVKTISTQYCSYKCKPVNRWDHQLD